MLTRRQRIAAWIKTDAQRRADAEVLARVTERLTAPAIKPFTFNRIAHPTPVTAKAWSDAINAEMNRMAYGTRANPSFSQRLGLTPFP